MTSSVTPVLSGMEEDLLCRPRHCRTGDYAPPEAMMASVDTTLPLQLLLFSFINSSSSASHGGVSKISSKAVSYSLLAQDAAGDESAAAAARPPTASDLNDCLWPVDAAFATREDAVKADVCRCIALHFERSLTGIGLVESLGGRLRWAHVASDRDGGSERLGVALTLDVFRCWKQVVVPLLQRISDRASRGWPAGAATVDALFDCLVKGPAAAAAPSSDASSPSASALTCEEAAYWCFALLRGYCQDFPETVWASILRAAQDAAVQQWSSSAVGLPPLPGEALLVRSFIAHLSCSEVDAACATSATALEQPKYDDIVVAHMSAAVAAARARAESWVWDEIELLQRTSADATVLDSSLSALLRADGYWAVLMQPYTAMFAQYYM
ncbi:hypothetical protein LMJF_35_3530 [Leishmania major strain Friedlin]|uniref:Uncharacterized protein n=1 Tax=Leishmania major TaxID=5664 RepID=E9AFH7_LEIMA|nr:hypothetical protein LMJF_35_3530 [Leishmania major strain Friedlin]CAG9582708.1 hypothetical_protein_-_conserved [Leishmania major strain Friedlin]CBZ12981.1 hypothetical protein LMJF_35_3530 [Leishmania major strain Friedlin]|eukprot:XP_003722747.1 hypothetical protein LMJF_35_3530 [Leishmania major strain Friedlin]